MVGCLGSLGGGEEEKLRGRLEEVQQEAVGKIKDGKKVRGIKSENWMLIKVQLNFQAKADETQLTEENGKSEDLILCCGLKR